MTRLLIGFFFGLMVAAAVGQIVTDTKVGSVTAPTGVNKIPVIPGTNIPQGEDIRGPNLLWDRMVLAGMRPDGQAAVIKVDAEGRVICSPEGQR